MRTLVVTDQSWSADSDTDDTVDRSSDTGDDMAALRSFHYGGS
jgi:hypothetical protein